MSYHSETEMYAEVAQWLSLFLRDKFPGGYVDAKDTHAFPLNDYIRRHGLQGYFNGDLWQTYDIHVDITAFVKTEKQLGLVFVECKTIPISLLHISQLLGYCRVALPLCSYLLSTSGAGDAVKSLILRYDRTDILEYYWGKGHLPRRIIIARWDKVSRNIDPTSILPPGS